MCVAVNASKVMLDQQHIRVLSQYRVAGLVTLDAGTATQVVYSASCVAERKVGLVQGP
jgi:hypothetical protein